ncbi:MAG TPA: hypothetical protein VKA31_11420 [Mariprofundaceae bacterium]|nr:hypothetical protein [Mariprofundaceae bacterium]
MAKEITFDYALKQFKSATTSSMKYARICAEMALREFADSGNLSQCQQFLDAMPKNYTRKAAFVQWVVDHSPLLLADGKFQKDKSDTANKLNIDGAMTKPFWDYVPEKPIINYSAKDVIEALERTIKRFDNSKKMHPATDDAVATLARVKAAIHGVEVVTKPDVTQPVNAGKTEAKGEQVGVIDYRADDSLVA